jgi:hypothetical protein
MSQKRRLKRVVFRPFGDEDLKRIAGEFMRERFEWVSDQTHPAYVARYATALEVMGYLREREERVLKVIIAQEREKREVGI